MSDADIEKVIRQNITVTPHMSLATVKDNQPWVCEVHFVCDDALNIYFVSLPSTRHCQEIAVNSHVAGNIVRQHDLSEAPNGVYFEGFAEQILPSRDEIINYCSRLNRDSDELLQKLNKDGDKRMYKISVTNWAFFGNVDGTGHKKYELSWSAI